MHGFFDVHVGCVLLLVCLKRMMCLWSVSSNVIGCASVFNMYGCRLYVYEEYVCSYGFNVSVCIRDADAGLSSLLWSYVFCFVCVSDMYGLL